MRTFAFTLLFTLGFTGASQADKLARLHGSANSGTYKGWASATSRSYLLKGRGNEGVANRLSAAATQHGLSVQLDKNPHNLHHSIFIHSSDAAKLQSFDKAAAAILSAP